MSTFILFSVVGVRNRFTSVVVVSNSVESPRYQVLGCTVFVEERQSTGLRILDPLNHLVEKITGVKGVFSFNFINPHKSRPQSFGSIGTTSFFSGLDRSSVTVT